jgi:AcrR family transcriptional regulator
MSFEPLTPDRRRAMTRRHLLEAAAIVFARDGFHGATLDAIASYAGFTKGAVYSNFKSKDDLFLALLDDRIDRQAAITAEVLDEGSQDPEGQLPHVRELMHGATYFWDDTFVTLYLEFILYARRNADARTKLAEHFHRDRTIIEELMEREYERLGARGRRANEPMAEISRALFNGLALARLVDPASVTDEMIDMVLDILMESMGVNDGPVDSAQLAPRATE